MGRVRTNIIVKGHNCWTLFDTGAKNTYVVQDLTSLLPTFELEKPEPVLLGGGAHKAPKICWLTCLVEGLPVHTHARVLQEMGKDEEGNQTFLLERKVPLINNPPTPLY